MNTVYKKPESLNDKSMTYCPGCTHGMVLRIVAEIIDELDLMGDTIGIASVGCTYNCYEYFNFDMVQASHGRAPAVATGIKRSRPDNFVFTYQGDGDLASIGIAEIIHAAIRGENISVVFVNNTVYGMTSGQMAPTTLDKQLTATTPYGRDKKIHGSPLRVCEMLSTIQAPAYIERTSMHDIKNIMKTKKAIKKSFQIQKANMGFSLVEVLSSCPTNWRLDPVKSLEWIKTNMIPVYPLGVFKGQNLEV